VRRIKKGRRNGELTDFCLAFSEAAFWTVFTSAPSSAAELRAMTYVVYQRGWLTACATC